MAKPTVALGAILPPGRGVARPAFEFFYENSIAKLYAKFRSGLEPNGRHFFSANVSLPRQTYQIAGGFNARFRQAEDRELGLRLEYKTKCDFYFLEAAAAYHNSQTGSFHSFMKRAQQYGHYDLEIANLYPSDPTLHPRYLIEHAHPSKYFLARLVMKAPWLILIARPVLVFLAQITHFAPLRKFAIAFCSLLYWIQYVDGYRLSSANKPTLTSPHKGQSHHDAA